MTSQTRPTTPPTGSNPPPDRHPHTRSLLVAATLAGPFFVVSAGVQSVAREGFDLRVHPLSQLSTGDLGWVQILTFALTGLGLIALAVAHRRIVREGAGRRAVPVLLGIAGVGFVLAGVFVMDPENGFPVGTPDGPAASMSWHGIAHSVVAAVAFTALAAAAVVLTVRAVRARRVLAAVGHGVVGLLLLMPVSPETASLQVAVNGLVAFTWTTVLALRLRTLVTA
ncbi:DUF998 domain-containing protein [Oerskovia paurometabola]|uniref:DUF998 domain-containing protein n=1 Tax=Oerskovia paurometabola TaxID=162170 RepID=A0ABW1XEC9_9CELL|nr:DUF998 domain-containing protein [Oerskovia paurometabola]MBM7496184.1 putative membrane protein [Oerskovia paurometabola]